MEALLRQRKHHQRDASRPKPSPCTRDSSVFKQRHWPGTSKWNKVEHRLFSFISMNWRGRPLTDYQVIVETIAATTTETGLTVAGVMDTNQYPTGIRVSDAQIKAVPVQRYAFHGEWNYVIHPGPIPETLRNRTIKLEPTT
jgi:DDE family transposase